MALGWEDTTKDRLSEGRSTGWGGKCMVHGLMRASGDTGEGMGSLGRQAMVIAIFKEGETDQMLNQNN